MHRAGRRPEGNVRTAGPTRSRSKLCRSRSRLPDEARDAVARLFYLLEARRVTGAHVASPLVAERASRHRDDLLVEQEALRELLRSEERRVGKRGDSGGGSGVVVA